MRLTGMQRTESYVEGVADGNIPAPPFIVRSVERWKESADRWVCDEQAFNRIVRMIEDMPTPQGTKQKFTLWPWQCYFLSWMFLFHDETGRRAIRELFLAVPRKAGKSSMMAAAGLATIAEPCGDIHAPLLLCFGVTDEMARMTFDRARKIVSADSKYALERKEKTFSSRYGFKETQEKIFCGSSHGLIRPLTSEARSLEGYEAEIIIADEISRMPTTQKLETLRSGFGAAHSPQMVMTSTPSDLPWSAYDSELERAMRWLQMKTDGSDSDDKYAPDPHYAAIVYAATEEDDPGDKRVWERTQPSYHTIASQPIQYQQEWRRAQADLRALHSFKTHQLCIPARLAGQWITIEDWLGTDDPPEKAVRGKDWQTFIGVDLSDVQDMTSICTLQVNERTDEQRVWFEVHYPRGSLPSSLGAKGEETYVENDALLWAEDGWLELHGGGVIDHARIAERLTKINTRLKPLTFISDQYSAMEEVKRHLAPPTRVKMRPYSKSLTRFTVPIATLTTWVRSGSISIQKHPVAERHLRNAVLAQGRHGGYILEKPAESSTAKIDAMDSLMCAIAGWVQSKDEKLLGTDDAPIPNVSKSLDYGMKAIGL